MDDCVQQKIISRMTLLRGRKLIFEGQSKTRPKGYLDTAIKAWVLDTIVLEKMLARVGVEVKPECWEPEYDQLCLACCHSTAVDAFEWTLPAVGAAEDEEPSDVQPDEIPRVPSEREQMIRRVHNKLVGTSFYDTDDHNYSRSWRNE